MLSPNSISHFFNGNIFGLGEKKQNEDRHDKNPRREKEEDSELEVTEHREKSLSDDESEEEIDADGDALSCRSSF